MPDVEGKVVAVCGSGRHWAPGKSLPYEKALRQTGIELLLISPGGAAPLNFSGLLLMGGSDVNPAIYGEERRPETGDPDDARDQLECALIADALRRDVPVLAICRGVQILNVQHGGTLVQHLATWERHRVRNPDRALPAHPVDIIPGTRLAAIVGMPLRLEVNSRHHQAIARPGAGLVVTVRDPEDGTIEAVERTDKRFVIGVQWHPENQIESDAGALKLFEAFADAL